MVDACEVLTSESARGTWDSASASYAFPAPVYTYQGPCRVKFNPRFPQQGDAAGQTVAKQYVVLNLPVDGSGGVTAGNVAVITSCPGDPSLVGRRFAVTGEFHQTYATARRVPVEEITGG